jgi:hypothetical protein
MKKHNLLNLYSGCGALFTLLSLGHASAADRKVYPGLMCVDENDQTPDVTYQANGAVHAVTTTDVLCPIVRDNTLGTAVVTDWDVVLNRGNNTLTRHDAWDIVLQSRNQDASSGFQAVISVPDIVDVVQILDGKATTNAFENGQIRLITKIPAGAEIVGYQVSESD